VPQRDIDSYSFKRVTQHTQCVAGQHGVSRGATDFVLKKLVMSPGPASP
jgi:hypothetical protein